MKDKSIAVISPKCSRESASRIAQLLGADYFPSTLPADYRGYDVVVNYGSSKPILCNKVINHPDSVRMCVNKISTLKRVKNGVEWTKDRDVALEWLKKDGAIVSRALEEGSRSEGVVISFCKEDFDTYPAKFWTRYFEHKHEVRINVFKDKILTVYEKVEEDGVFVFYPLEIQGEKNKEVQEMIHSVQENIGIVMYGMDVLVNKKGDCKLLEINSGAILLPETEETLIDNIFKEIYKND